MRKWLKRILVGVGCFVAFLLLALYFGGRWAAQKYLAKDLKVGAGTARLVSPEFRWSLDLKADSALFDSPTLKAAAGRTVVSANLFKSLLKFSPSVTLNVDTVLLRIIPGPDTVKPKQDSIAFPDFKIPAAVAIKAGRLLVFDTAADSLGPLVRADGVLLETTGPQSVALRIKEARARHTKAVPHALALVANWGDATQVTARLAWRRDRDSITVAAQLPKANLLRAVAQMKARIASTKPYYQALEIPGAPPTAQDIELELQVALNKTLRLETRISARLSGFPDSAPFKLGPQRVTVQVDFQDSAGTWSILSDGDKGEDIQLAGNLFATASDSLENPAWLIRNLGVTAKGHLRGITVVTAGKKMRADLEVGEVRAASEALRARMTTGEGSRISAELRKPAASKEWSGRFSADLVPQERWLMAFTDTNVVFAKAHITGTIKGGEVAAQLDAKSVRAYGVMADSLRSYHRYGKAGYELKPSHLYWEGARWEVAGKVEVPKPGTPMSVGFRNAEYGSAEGAMPKSGVMELHIRNLALDRVPYKGMDTLKANQPRVTGDFKWDMLKRTGAVEIKVAGKYKGEALQAQAQAEWDSQRLQIRETKASLAGSELTASAKVLLRGKHFYELGKLSKDEFEEVTLSSDRFDIAKAMSVVMPAPPLKSGIAVGKFSYSAKAGFAGTYRFQNIHMGPEEDETIGLKELAIFGKGDTLLVKGITVSEQEQLFNDTATLALTGVLGKEQGLDIKARLGPKVFLDFQGRIQNFNDLKGRLGIRGDAVLPGASGELRGVVVRADVAFTFKEGVKGLRLEADTLGGKYLVAGLDTQTFSAPVKMVAGKIAIPKFSMRSKGGAETTGKFEFNPATKKMNGSLTGNSLAVQFGKSDKFKVRDFKLDLNMDSTAINVQVFIGSGSAERVKAPMRAAGDFSRVIVTYRAPLGNRRGGAYMGGRIPFLKVEATLDRSDVRYRLRSMETLQNLFKRTPQKRTAKRSQAMQLQIDLETAGRGNHIETDILRVSYVGNFSMHGIYPYSLVQGRISSYKGELGMKKQAYSIRNMDVKWLNTPMSEGKIELGATKRLARNCEAGTLDSCNISTRLTGKLSDMQFTYDSDCEGASGAAVEVSALVYSVRRGCYSSAFRGGGAGLSYQEQAFGLLEPVASQYLSDAAGKLTGNWISSAQVSGLGALAANKKKTSGGQDTGSTEAIALEILSKEFWRTRLRVKSAYAPENDESSNPWNYRVGLEWRPPLPWFIEDPKWKKRLQNNVNMEAAIYTDPDRNQQNEDEDQLRRRLGLNYTYDFWGGWWGKQAKSPAATPEHPEKNFIPKKPVSGTDRAR